MKHKLPLLILGSFLSFQLFSNSTNAFATPEVPTVESQNGSIGHTIEVTAQVPLTNLWEEQITKNSVSALVEKGQIGKQTMFSLSLYGLNQTPMVHEYVDAVITKEGQHIAKIEGLTDDNSQAIFGFTPKDNGLYLIEFYYNSWDKTIKLPTTLSINY